MAALERLLHLDRTLDELDPPRWDAPPADATRLVRKVHALRRVPLGELRPADLQTLLAQRVGLPYVLPLTVRLLVAEPLLDAWFYEGDLLLTAVAVPDAAWDALPGLAARLAAVVADLPEAAVADLPRGAAREIVRFGSRFGSGSGSGSGSASEPPVPWRSAVRRAG